MDPGSSVRGSSLISAARDGATEVVSPAVRAAGAAGAAGADGAGAETGAAAGAAGEACGVEGAGATAACSSPLAQASATRSTKPINDQRRTDGFLIMISSTPTTERILRRREATLRFARSLPAISPRRESPLPEAGDHLLRKEPRRLHLLLLTIGTSAAREGGQQVINAAKLLVHLVDLFHDLFR